MTARASQVDRFFTRHRALRAVIDAVLEGRQGQVVAAGEAAVLRLGCYEVFGGDASSPEARRLVKAAARPSELVYGNDPGWRRLILEVHGPSVIDRPMVDYEPGGLDPTVLERLRRGLPDGFLVRPLDLALAGQLDIELEPHGLQVFSSASDLVESGAGFGAVRRGRLVSASTSYARSSARLEVAVATRPAFRGRGLATAVAAALLRHCLDLGIAPRWSAGNPVSQRLAMRLGFQPAGECEVLYLT